MKVIQTTSASLVWACLPQPSLFRNRLKPSKYVLMTSLGKSHKAVKELSELKGATKVIMDLR